jgi:ribosomal protein S18 acetylase RimI-like enzyme
VIEVFIESEMQCIHQIKGIGDNNKLQELRLQSTSLLLHGATRFIRQMIDMPMNTEIRPAMRADIDSLITLSRQTISACYRVFLSDQVVEEFIDSGSADEYIRENIQNCLVIVSEGNIVGYSVIKENLIDLMMIDHRFHHCGFGTQLLRHLEEKLSGTFDELVLESFEGNEQAHSFYRKNEWSEEKRFFDEISGVNKIVFRKAAISQAALPDGFEKQKRVKR